VTDSVVQVQGRTVPIHGEGSASQLRPSSVAEMGAIVIQALIEGAHLPLAAAIKAIVLSVTQTAFEVSVEIEDLQVRRLISLRGVVAKRYNEALLELDSDHYWDHEVREIFRERLISDLKREINRRP